MKDPTWVAIHVPGVLWTWMWCFKWIIWCCQIKVIASTALTFSGGIILWLNGLIVMLHVCVFHIKETCHKLCFLLCSKYNVQDILDISQWFFLKTVLHCTLLRIWEEACPIIMDKRLHCAILFLNLTCPTIESHSTCIQNKFMLY